MKSCATCARVLAPVSAVERAWLESRNFMWCAPLSARLFATFRDVLSTGKTAQMVVVSPFNFGGLSCATLKDGKRGDLYQALDVGIANGLEMAVNGASSGVIVNKTRPTATVQGALW